MKSEQCGARNGRVEKKRKGNDGRQICEKHATATATTTNIPDTTEMVLWRLGAATLRTLCGGLDPHVERVALRAGKSREGDVHQLVRPIDREGKAGVVPEADVHDIAVPFASGSPPGLLRRGLVQFFQKLAIDGFRIDEIGSRSGFRPAGKDRGQRNLRFPVYGSKSRVCVQNVSVA